MKSFTVEIEKIVYGGRGMGRVNGKVVFVPFTVPGDKIEAEATKEKKDYLEGVIKEFLCESPLRITPFCRLFGRCGGCHYQHIPYPEQLSIKERNLKEALRQLLQEGGVEFLPIVPSPQSSGYRIRCQLKGRYSGGKEILGFYGLKTHRVVEVEECPLLHPSARDLLQGMKRWLGKKGGEYLVQGADIQVSPDEGKGIICLKGRGDLSPALAERLHEESSVIKGIVNEGARRAVWGELSLLYQGPRLGEQKPLELEADYASFTQVNPYQNWNLIQRVVAWADLRGQEKVLDLFCGSGNLTLPLAQRAFRVWGVDQDETAIAYAQKNARANHLSNCRFIAASAEAGLRRLGREAGSVDLAVLDPPRAGVKESLEALARLRPKKIIYVSCEPPTLIRDLMRLGALGYRLKKIQPLDMFPQTYHVEAVAELLIGSEGPRVQGFK